MSATDTRDEMMAAAACERAHERGAVRLPLRAQPPGEQTQRPTRRHHGCGRPWPLAQIIAVGAVLLNSGVFYGLVADAVPEYLQDTITVLVSMQLAVVVALFMSISLLDPAHPAVIWRDKWLQQQRQQQQQPRRLHGSNYGVTSESISARVGPPFLLDLEMGNDSGQASPPSAASPPPSSSEADASPRLHCALCAVQVSTGTRHCHLCHKCVAGFDHHCVYLNTCIGARNYPLFIALLCCTILLLATQLALAAFAVHAMFQQTAHRSRGVVVLTLSFIPSLELICLLVLALFHAFLLWRGLKTHEWLRRFRRAAPLTGKTPRRPRQARQALEGQDPNLHVTSSDG